MPAQRREKYNAACQQCRRRKAKCDGQHPCARCIVCDDECTYGEGSDGRRAYSRAYVKSLEARVAYLEGLMQEPEAAQRADEGLKFDDESHELHHYGPSSNLQHIPEPPTDLPSAHFDPWTRSDASIDARPDWSRHLPKMDDWDEALHSSLLDAYFATNGFYNIVDGPSFYHDMQKCLTGPTTMRTSNYSPVLQNAILAVACQLTDDPRASTAAGSLLRASQHELFIEGDRPTLSTIQGVLLIAIFFTCEGKHRLGYFYAGIAIRMCHTLGLHVDCSGLVTKGVLKEADRRARERTLRVCYVFDKLWSSYMGHDPSLVKEAIEIPIEDGATFGQTCRLAIIQEKVMRSLYARRPPADRLNIVSALSLELDSWFENVPIQLKVMPQTLRASGETIVMNIYYHFITILLHRNIDSSRCRSAAVRISSLLALYDRTVGLRRAPVVLVQFGAMAAMVDDSSGRGGGGGSIIESLRQIGRPYGASIQHCEMLARLQDPQAREPQPLDFDALLTEMLGPIELFPSFMDLDWEWDAQHVQ